jgi:NADH:ubiquinone oxidoreductase subunit E
MIIKICNWKSCQDNFNSYIIIRLKNDIERFELKNVKIEEVSCMWMCDEWPIIKIDKEILKHATPIKASEMMFRKINWEKPKKKKSKEEYKKDDNFDENYIK